MLQRLDLRGAGGVPRTALPRATVDVDAAVPAVRPILDAVRERGAAAVRELTARFDGVDQSDPRVPAEALKLALADLDPDVRAAMDESIDRQRLVSDALRPADQTVTVAPGATVSSRWTPVDRVGLYVPGGLAAYPSTVIMNVVPARSAGVESLALASPAHPEHGGYPHPTVLAACALLGVDEVYAVGGAQAIAMFAYGTTDCPRVDLVAGPGNVYVAAAKRLLRGLVGIDAEAGTTEIAVLADDTADPDQVAADLVSQAEHDPMAASVLVTPSTALADAVDAALVRAVAATRHRDRVTQALTGPQSGTVLVRDLDHGVAVVDEYAAEHLEVVTADARAVAARVRHAGCVFVGPDSPVPLGDYCAGSNHVLPTGGTARHTSGLSVTSYLKRVQVVDYDRAALTAVAPRVTALAEAEDLPAHADAITARTGP